MAFAASAAKVLSTEWESAAQGERVRMWWKAHSHADLPLHLHFSALRALGLNHHVIDIFESQKNIQSGKSNILR